MGLLFTANDWHGGASRRAGLKVQVEMGFPPTAQWDAPGALGLSQSWGWR